MRIFFRYHPIKTKWEELRRSDGNYYTEKVDGWVLVLFFFFIPVFKTKSYYLSANLAKQDCEDLNKGIHFYNHKNGSVISNK